MSQEDGNSSGPLGGKESVRRKTRPIDIKKRKGAKRNANAHSESFGHRSRGRKTPIERIFLEVIGREMTPGEREMLLGGRKKAG